MPKVMAKKKTKEIKSFSRRVSNRSSVTEPFRKRSVRSQETIERFSEILLRAIRAKISASAFTRDDLLSLVTRMRLDSSEEWARGAYGVNDVTTGTRYRKVCYAVQHLIAKRQLATLDWLRLCLPDEYPKLITETPPHVLYLPTIRRLVQKNFLNGQRIDAMAVVDKWKSDQHVPENLKRMAVRGAFPQLVKESILARGQVGEFTIR